MREWSFSFLSRDRRKNKKGLGEFVHKKKEKSIHDVKHNFSLQESRPANLWINWKGLVVSNKRQDTHSPVSPLAHRVFQDVEAMIR